MTTEELKSLHQAGRKKEIIDAVSGWYGGRCASCGNVNEIEYHHIVPLYVGGSNKPTNIVPLCRRCHQSLHSGVNLRTSQIKRQNGGRKMTVPSEDDINLFAQYVWCKIPRSEYEKRSQRRSNSVSKWQTKYLEAHDIIKFHNNIGCALSKRGYIDIGDCVGWIKQIINGKVVGKEIRADRRYTAEEFGISVNHK